MKVERGGRAAAAGSGAAPVRGAVPLALAWIAASLLWQLRHDATFFTQLSAAVAATLRQAAWPGAAPWLRHLAALILHGLFALLAASAVAAAGRRLLGWVGDLPLSPLERAASAGLCGLAVWCTAGLGLGLAGLYRPPVGWLALALLAWTGWRGRFSLGRTARVLAATGGGDVFTPCRWAPFVLVTAGVALTAAAPETTEDGLSYHLAAPDYFRAIGRIVDAPHLQFRWPLLFEQWLALTGPRVSLRLPGALAFWNLALLTTGWAGRVLGPATARPALWGLLCSAGLFYFTVALKSDLLAAALGFMALVVWAAAPRRTGSGAGALVAGAALGWTFCTKYTAVAIAPALIALARPGRRNFAWGAIGFAAAAGPFLLKAGILTGNPVFPAAFGGLGWSRALERVTLPGAWSPGPRIPGAPLDVPPYTLLVLHDQWPLVALGLPLLALWPGTGAGVWLQAAVLAVAAWAVAWPYYRFMMPITPVLIALAAAGVARSPWTASRGLRLAALLLCGAGGLVQTVSLVHETGPNSRPVLLPALGLQAPGAFARGVLGSAWDAAAFVRSRPTPGRLLVVGDSRGAIFHGAGPAISQDIADPPVLGAVVRASTGPDDIARRLRQLGVTRVALNAMGSIRRGMFASLVGLTMTADERRRWHAYWTAHAEPVYVGTDRVKDDSGHWAVWELHRRPAEPGFRSPYLPGTEELIDPTSPAPVDRQIAFLERVTAEAPSVACFRVRLTELLATRGRWAEMVPHLRAAIGGGLFEKSNRMNLIVTLGHLRRWREASAAAREALGAYPGDPDFSAALRECAAMGGRPRP